MELYTQTNLPPREEMVKLIASSLGLPEDSVDFWQYSQIVSKYQQLIHEKSELES